MSFPYNFTKLVAIPDAFNKYVRDNLTFQSLYTSLSVDSENGTITLYFSEELITGQLDELTTLVGAYTDPATYLTLLSSTLAQILLHFMHQLEVPRSETSML